jgi:hypothetical protein
MTMARRLLLAMLFVLCAFAAGLRAQAPPSFRDGVMAFEKGEWSKAETAMRAAVAGNPNESIGTVQIAGQWYETYVPHYFLARSLAKLGRCEEAMREFAESERQGVTAGIPDFARYLKSRGGCKPQPRPATPPKVIHETTIPFGELETTTAVATPAVPMATTSPAKASVREPSAGKAAEAAVSAARARLSAGVNAYLHGRYDEAVRLLTASPFQDRAAAAQAALFLAAARHALYRIGGEQDARLRAQIESDLRRYAETNPNSRPDPRLFPPGFIALARGGARNNKQESQKSE